MRALWVAALALMGLLALIVAGAVYWYVARPDSQPSQAVSQNAGARQDDLPEGAEMIFARRAAEGNMPAFEFSASDSAQPAQATILTVFLPGKLTELEFRKMSLAMANEYPGHTSYLVSAIEGERLPPYTGVDDSSRLARSRLLCEVVIDRDPDGELNVSNLRLAENPDTGEPHEGVFREE